MTPYEHFSEDRSPLMSCMEVWGGIEPTDHGLVMPGLDAWVFSAPSERALEGGDVYYVSSCASGRITRLLVADVSGHGAEVAKTAKTLRTLMRRYVNQLDQSHFIRALNQEFVTISQDGGFATAVAATYFAPKNCLALTNAGHPPPALYRADTMEWSFLETVRSDRRGPSNVPLGILDTAEYDRWTLHLDHGDMVLCYTDSLIESRDRDGSFLGQDGLLELLTRLDISKPHALIECLLASIQAISKANLSEDDVTALLFTPNDLRPTQTLRQRFLMPAQLMTQVADSLRPGGAPMPWPDLNLANIGGAMFSPFNRLWRRCARD